MTAEGKKDGSLTVVGSGIKFLSHVTTETPSVIEQADRVLYGVLDPATANWIRGLNPGAEALCDYLPDRPRKATYESWIARMIECVVAGENVCVVLYGHPGVYAYASHEAIRRVGERGYAARMLPGISAADCLYADLGLDPAVSGIQSYEATDFLVRPRTIDTSTGLLLWQCGVVGQLGAGRGDAAVRRQVLADALIARYGADHEVILYEAPSLAMFDPVIERLPLARLADTEIGPVTTLYIPPKQRAGVDLEVVDRLGIARDQLDALDVGQPEDESQEKGNR